MGSPRPAPSCFYETEGSFPLNFSHGVSFFLSEFSLVLTIHRTVFFSFTFPVLSYPFEVEAPPGSLYRLTRSSEFFSTSFLAGAGVYFSNNRTPWVISRLFIGLPEQHASALVSPPFFLRRIITLSMGPDMLACWRPSI